MAVAFKTQVAKDLSAIVGSRYVSDDLAVLLTYTRDTSVLPPSKPQAVVVRPGTQEELVQIVRYANNTRTPLIPLGGKATVGGAPPGSPGRGIIVDMRRLCRFIELDEVNMAVTVEAGIGLAVMAAKCQERGWDVVTVGQPLYADTVGGHIAGTPGGGFSGYGYSVGFNQQYIIGLKVVLADGSVVSTGTGEDTLNTYKGKTWARGMHGPDFTGMFEGTGGMYGIIVEATYRIYRAPKFKRTKVRTFDTLEQCNDCYMALWEVDPYLYMQPYTNCMIMGPETLDQIEKDYQRWVLPFMCIARSQEELDLKIKQTDELCAKYGGVEASKDVDAFAQKFTGDFCHEMGQMATLGQLPLFELILSRRDCLPAFKFTYDYVKDHYKAAGYDARKVGLISGLLSCGTGFGMTTVIPTFDANDVKLKNLTTEMFTDWLDQCMRRGYVPEATAGHESNLHAKQWTGDFYHYAKRMKDFLDPNNIMNPGVFFP